MIARSFGVALREEERKARREERDDFSNPPALVPTFQPLPCFRRRPLPPRGSFDEGSLTSDPLAWEMRNLPGRRPLIFDPRTPSKSKSQAERSFSSPSNRTDSTQRQGVQIGPLRLSRLLLLVPADEGRRGNPLFPLNHHLLPRPAHRDVDFSL